ncbi:hypothetical protein BC629DRAFT_1591953 [Irpex lacteus]|nr:hypothetical protein BC629DRAFT_1591953 [Irpex lacteus]
MVFSKQQVANIDVLSSMKDPLCDWNEYTGRTSVMLTCFFAQAGGEMIVVPQQRYRPPRDEWYEAEVTEKKEQENRASANKKHWVCEVIGDENYMAVESLETWTFSTEGKFGVNLQEALDGSAEVTSRFLEASEDDGGVGMALHILWPGCLPCYMPMPGDFESEGLVDLVVIARAVAENVEVFIRDSPRITDLALYQPWNIANVQLKDLTLLQLKKVSNANGWQPVLALRREFGPQRV